MGPMAFKLAMDAREDQRMIRETDAMTGSMPTGFVAQLMNHLPWHMKWKELYFEACAKVDPKTGQVYVSLNFERLHFYFPKVYHDIDDMYGPRIGSQWEH